MAWLVETGPDGRPIWKGCDSILNTNQQQAIQLKGCGYPAVIVLLVIALMMIVGGTGGRPVDTMGGAIGWLVFVVAAPSAYLLFRMGRGLSMREWFNPAWVLRATEDGFEFKRESRDILLPASWSVRLEDVARVEVGRTTEWQPSRTVSVGGTSGVIMETPSFETQVFLFMADQSRRVVYSVNANSEATTTLAHSIRSYVESQKAEAAPAAAAVRNKDPGQEGFQL